MKFIFYSISNNFEKFHRRNEIEELVNSNIHTEAIYFTPPKFVFKAFFSKPDKQIKYHSKIRICNLYILIPLRLGLNCRILKSIFITGPIKLQTWYAKKRYFSQSNSNKTISWFYKPDQYLYLKLTEPYIYLHYDNYQVDTSYKFSSDKQFDETLNDCIKNSYITLISSYNLYNNYKHLKVDGIHYYPNAISRSLLPFDNDVDTTKKNPVVIGFIGQLDKTFDTTLVEKIASTYPNYRIKLIGTISNSDVSKLGSNYSNIELLGYMKYKDLSKQIKGFSIGICPYIRSDFNKYRNPLKITEYFSYGAPVVTVECDFDRQAETLLSVASSDDDFVKLIEVELQDNSSSKVKQRKLLAKNNCWDNRAKFLAYLLDEL